MVFQLSASAWGKNSEKSLGNAASYPKVDRIELKKPIPGIDFREKIGDLLSDLSNPNFSGERFRCFRENHIYRKSRKNISRISHGAGGQNYDRPTRQINLNHPTTRKVESQHEPHPIILCMQSIFSVEQILTENENENSWFLGHHKRWLSNIGDEIPPKMNLHMFWKSAPPFPRDRIGQSCCPGRQLGAFQK